ncbi:MAG: ABC transporter ATP-binding protein [Ilumatobacteraceae bacterium]|jgi:branched-chain amino acid transport system ATP-binding protein
MSGELLELDRVTVRYGRVAAVRGVSLRISPGEVVAIVGPNGAGKSTLLAAVMGMVRVAEGEVRWSGRSITAWRPDQIARSGISLVPEGRQIFGDLSVSENLRLGAVARADRTRVGQAMDEVLALFPVLAKFSQRPAGLLSGGQQQQLAIARSLLADPQLLLLDEPSLGLSPTMIDVVFEALDAVRAAGRTILLVEQRANRAIAFADRALVLAGGEIQASIGADQAHNDEVLRHAYFGTHEEAS